jgi:hypothetical protein
MNKTKFLAIAVPIALLITLVINGFAASGALNGIDTGSLSDLYPVLFTPAGYVFSIWSLIYTNLIAFSLYQLRPTLISESTLNRLRTLTLGNFILNSLWILAWQYQYLVISLLIMAGLLLSLIAIYKEATKLTSNKTFSKFWLKAPFSLYLGWICVATIANASVVLYDLNWNQFGMSALFWTIVMIGVATVLALFFQWLERDLIVSGVVVWAIIGITVKHPEIVAIRNAVGAAILVLIASTIASVSYRKRLDR